MRLIVSGVFYVEKMWGKYGKWVVFRAAMDGLGKTARAATAGLGSKGFMFIARGRTQNK